MKKRLLLTAAALLVCLVFAGQTGFGVLAAEPAEGEPVTEEVFPEGEPVTEEVFPEEELTFPDGAWDPDGLFAEFAQKRLYEGLSESAAPAKTSSGEYLDGRNAIIYRILRERIAAVANGDVQSTEFTISLEELGLSDVLCTASDLGVDYIIGEDGTFSDAAISALRSQYLDYDISRIMKSLLADCPYDLYWFDKTQGVRSGGISIRITEAYRDGEWQDAVSFSNALRISFAVAQEYAAGTYQIDPSSGQAVALAADNASRVVEDYADLSDYEKLDAYRGWICAEVSYNDEAADDSTGTPYGNPWQLIWVFDGDASTKVVCEGYAKAFQYLCDLSTFQSRRVGSIVVDGYMGGNHMWNVVTMEDGLHYHVDITNCDEGSIGEDRLLFLAGTRDGSVQDGYSFECGYFPVQYYYSQDTLNLYKERDLTLAKSNYGTGQYVPVTGITLDQSQAQMPTSLTTTDSRRRLLKASTLQLQAQVLPENATDRDVLWTSSDPAVASVDDEGLVIAWTCGETVITAETSDGGLTAQCVIRTLYNDVAQSSKYWYAPVYWAAEEGITKGYGNIYFGPEENCTREQLITFLWRMVGSPEPKSTTKNPFSDVKSGAYYYKAVLWAREQGITNGYSSGPYKGKFGVSLQVTREDTVTFLHRAAGKPSYDTTSSFKDVEEGKYYYNAIMWAAENGITKGYSSGANAGKFGVGFDVLRKDIVTFMYRYAANDLSDH